MGPTCEVLLLSNDNATLDTIEVVLSEAAEEIVRTRKGRVWDLRVDGRPVHVAVIGKTPVVTLAAGCNSPEDYLVLRRLANKVAEALGSVASPPVK